MKSIFIIILGLSISLHSMAEHLSKDTTKTSKGKLSGQWRTYLQSTHNEGDLKDFYALATGGKVKYEYHISSKLNIGTAIYTTINAGLQDLTIGDAATGRLSRYESGLFDLTDLSKTATIILGELYLNYHTDKYDFKVGRMKLKTPFLNPEDGRMIPTLEQGIWLKAKASAKVKLQLGLIHQIAPRSTGEFYSLQESLGKYAVGRNNDGTGSGYGGNTNTDFLAVANLNFQLSDNVIINLWDYHLDNVFNMIYLKPEFDLKGKSGKVSFEFLHQTKVGNGGNELSNMSYFNQNSSTLAGAQYKFKMGKNTFSINYNHIFDQGRFLFPREWGREPFFTFQKRERSDGSASNDAFMVNHQRAFKLNNAKIKSIISIGKHWKADVSNAFANKYALPSYTQYSLDLFYTTPKVQRLKVELLLTYKKGNGNIADNPKLILNKVNMLSTNLIVNYTF